ncbi:MAG: FMN-binding glutamate synthase family protein [Nitrospirae bacterium]|nr:FMN-binding glutamate synthase family protein [Nitrospirota bacterium]
MIQSVRTQLYWAVIALSILFTALGGRWAWGLLITVPLVVLGTWDHFQASHGLLRNYPIMGHVRYLIEDTGAELRQYVVESNLDGRPFNRDMRSLIYQRSKGVADKKPFGTELDVYQDGYGWMAHSMVPRPVCDDPLREFRVEVGAPGTTRPYSCSIYNISAMSFGSLSGAAIRALNEGARLGEFAHVTGEGGISRYHWEPGGDLIWQIGTGYFGCRNTEGEFDPELFRDQAVSEQVKMIELKLSQGAKPGHGGILPGGKVTQEIAEARHVPVGVDCISPAHHSAFSTPIGLLEFIASLRELAGGKPVGFKLCVGRPHEFYAVCKAMVHTGIVPDFITVDGGEGGTGAAPIEFSNHVGLPLREGLVFVQNALVGIGVRDQIRIAGSGKLVSAFHLTTALALGADWCNSARGFMFSLGCIQAQSCHTNRCPVGVATQDPRLTRGIVVADKSRRVANFHRSTVEALAEVVAAAGLDRPRDLTPRLIYGRTSQTEVHTYAGLFEAFEPGQLLNDCCSPRLQYFWDAASAETFAPQDPVG